MTVHYIFKPNNLCTSSINNETAIVSAALNSDYQMFGSTKQNEAFFIKVFTNNNQAIINGFQNNLLSRFPLSNPDIFISNYEKAFNYVENHSFRSILSKAKINLFSILDEHVNTSIKNLNDRYAWHQGPGDSSTQEEKTGFIITKNDQGKIKSIDYREVNGNWYHVDHQGKIITLDINDPQLIITEVMAGEKLLNNTKRNQYRVILTQQGCSLVTTYIDDQFKPFFEELEENNIDYYGENNISKRINDTIKQIRQTVNMSLLKTAYGNDITNKIETCLAKNIYKLIKIAGNSIIFYNSKQSKVLASLILFPSSKINNAPIDSANGADQGNKAQEKITTIVNAITKSQIINTNNDLIANIDKENGTITITSNPSGQEKITTYIKGTIKDEKSGTQGSICDSQGNPLYFEKVDDNGNSTN